MAQLELLKNKKKPPIERFEAWLSKPKNKQIVIQILKNLWGWYGNAVAQWSTKQFAEMRNWIITEPQKANKKQWGRFVRGWLTKGFHDTAKTKLEFGYVELKGMSRYQENKHFNNKKRDRDNGI